jgi:SsrA-binding protein
LVKGRKDIEKRKLEKERDIKINEKREAKEFMKF